MLSLLLQLIVSLAVSQVSYGLYHCCPDGWIVFRESCYKVGVESRSWQQAQEECDRLDATLFVADTSVEIDSVLREYGVRSLLSWIGLSYDADDWEETIAWQGNGRFPISKLPWMNRKDANNGHQHDINCVAYYAHANHHLGYVNW